MKAYLSLLKVNLLLYLREPGAVFFSLILPVLLLLLFGFIFGNTPMGDSYGQFGYVDGEVPGLLVIVMITVGFLQIPANLTIQKTIKVLRSFQLTPLKPATYIIADISANIVIVIFTLLVLALVGSLFFDLKFAGSLLLLSGGIVLCCLVFFLAGYVIANFSKSPRAAQAVGNMLFFPSLFLSDAAIPLNIMPDNMVAFAKALLPTKAVFFLRDIWFGNDALGSEFLVLSIALGILFLLAIVTFRWDAD